MNKNLAGSFLVLIFIFGIFISSNVRAFGELETNQYQTVQYDWFKGIFEGGLFSTTAPASGCTEHYVNSVSSLTWLSSSYFPQTITCSASGLNMGNYFCKIVPIIDGVWKPAITIDQQQTYVMNWQAQSTQQYQVSYYNWNCPTPTFCTPNIISNSKCTDNIGTFSQCKSDGSNWVTKSISGYPNTVPNMNICQTGYKCTVWSLSAAPTCEAVAPSCSPNWQWGIWDVCKSNNQQTRTGTDACGNTQTQTQACTYAAPTPSCTPVWQPDSWGSCINGQQTRTVTTDTCGKTTTETQGCSVSPPPATCTEGQKQLNSCPDGTTYDYKICRNNNWEVIPYATSPCQQISTQPPSWDGYYVLYNNECLKSNLLPNIDRSKYTAYGDLEMCQKDISSDFDGSTTAILAIGGLSALLVGMGWWFVRKRK